MPGSASDSPSNSVGGHSDLPTREIQALKETAYLNEDNPFRRLLEASTSILWMADATGAFASHQPAWEAFTGQPWDRQQGVKWREAIYPDDRKVVEELWANPRPPSHAHRLHLRVWHEASGQHRRCQGHCLPLFREDGSVGQWIGAFTDVQEQSVAQIALQEYQDREHSWATAQAAILEAVPALVWIARDPSGRHITGNRASYQLLQVNPGENVSKSGREASELPYRILQGGLEVPVEQLPLQQAARNGIEMREVEQEIVFADGTRRWIFGNAVPMYDAQGKLLGGVAAFVDVTHLKQSEEERAQLAAIVTSSEDAIIGKDINGTIRNWNAAAERLYGYTADEIIGQPMEVLVPEEHREEIWRHVRAAAQGQIGVRMETQRLHRDGHRLEISLTISPVVDDSGRPIGVSGIERDIRSRKQMEHRLREAQRALKNYAHELEQRVEERTRQLHETNQSLEGFCYSVAHDLRAPLRALQGFSGILKEEFSDALNAEGNRVVDRIVHASQRMDQLIRDLLDYGRLSRKEIPLGNVDLNEVLAQVLASLKPEIQSRGAQIRLEGPLPAVIANDTLLSQILGNLVSNGMKFVKPGTSPELRLSAETKEGMVRVSVTDNGIGIAPEYQTKVFQVFERLHPSSEYPGTGIGLAIVAKSVEKMGGRTGLESQPGAGSTFWFELPPV